MRQGPILFILIVAAYVGFEAFAVSKTKYRMEPVYIFERFVAVDRAMTRCGEADAAMQDKFARNRASVRRNAERDLADRNPAEAPEAIEQMLEEILRTQEADVDTLIDNVGCDDIEIFKLTRGYENRARLNLTAPPRVAARSNES